MSSNKDPLNWSEDSEEEINPLDSDEICGFLYRWRNAERDNLDAVKQNQEEKEAEEHWKRQSYQNSADQATATKKQRCTKVVTPKHIMERLSKAGKKIGQELDEDSKKSLGLAILAAKDFHIRLGLTSGVFHSRKEIKHARNQLARAFHPDKNSTKNKEIYVEVIKKINEAYEAIGE